VKIGLGVWALQVRKNKVRKEKEEKGRKGKYEFRLAFSHISGGELGGVIITKFDTRVHVCCVMILVIFGVDILRDVDFVRG
jgi:hypothetical protein